MAAVLRLKGVGRFRDGLQDSIRLIDLVGSFFRLGSEVFIPFKTVRVPHQQRVTIRSFQRRPRNWRREIKNLQGLNRFHFVVRTPIESTKDELSQLRLFQPVQSYVAQSQTTVSSPVEYGNSTVGICGYACSNVGMEDLHTKYDSKTVQIVIEGELLVMNGKVTLIFPSVGRTGDAHQERVELAPRELENLYPHKDTQVADLYFSGFLPLSI